MKRIIIICTLWCCALFARAQTIADLSYNYTGQSSPFCCTPNTWCYSNINCGSGPFNCGSFNPSALDFKIYFSTPNPGGTIGPNPFRTKIELFLNGVTVLNSIQLQTSTSWCQWAFYGVPVVSGQYQAKILFQKFNITGWVNVGTYFTNTININLCPPPPPCTSNVIISGNPFTTALTESQDWIQTSGTTIIPAGGNVKLDAEPVNGFVALDPGFEAQNGATFVAQALDGCGGSTPQKTNPPVVTTPGPAPGITVFPNPTTGQLNIRMNEGKHTLQLWNSMGALITTIKAQAGLNTIDISKHPPGIYFLRAEGKTIQRIVKQ